MGIEPTSKAWEAFVLPLNYTRLLKLLAPPRGIFARSGVASRAVSGSLLRPPRAPTAKFWEDLALPLNYNRKPISILARLY